MTVPAAVTTYRYQGNGVTTVFAYSNRLITTNDVEVKILTRATDAVVETLTITTDYTVTIVSNSLANITITNPAKIPSGTQDILLSLNLAITQTRSYPRADSLPAADIELGLDKLTLIAQLLNDSQARSLRFPESDTITDGELPPKAERALTYMAFNADGEPIASVAAIAGAPAGAFGAVLVGTVTQAEAVAALGISSAPFVDSTAIIKGSSDATKLLRFEVDGFTTGTTRVITPPNYNGTMATLAGTETLTAKTISGANNTITNLGTLLAIQVFTGSGTYTPNALMTKCRVRMIGGGGAGCGTSSSNQGNGGGSGSYGEGIFTAAQIGASKAVTIGAGGTGASGAAGGDGGTTSLGALMTAPGGKGGASTSGASMTLSSAGSGGYINYAGGVTPSGIPNTVYGANGAASQFGGNGVGSSSATGGAAVANSGSGGGATYGGTFTGGAGGSGTVIIEEYL